MNVNECLNPETLTECDQFVDEKCTYTGVVVYEASPGMIADAVHCHDLCTAYDALGCAYWKFDQETHICMLLDSRARSCDRVFGPQYPLMTDECHVSP